MLIPQLVPKPSYLDSMNWPGDKADMYDYKYMRAAKLVKYS